MTDPSTDAPRPDPGTGVPGTPASETAASEARAAETPASETPASETPASETPAPGTLASAPDTLVMATHPIRWFVVAIVAVGVVLAALGLSGLANPRIDSGGSASGQWDAATNVGASVIRVENRGLFAVDVVGASGEGVDSIDTITAVEVTGDAPLTNLVAVGIEPTETARIDAQTTVDLIIQGRFRCDLVEPRRYSPMGYDLAIEVRAPVGPTRTRRVEGLVPMNCPGTDPDPAVTPYEGTPPPEAPASTGG